MASPIPPAPGFHLLSFQKVGRTHFQIDYGAAEGTRAVAVHKVTRHGAEPVTVSREAFMDALTVESAWSPDIDE